MKKLLIPIISPILLTQCATDITNKKQQSVEVKNTYNNQQVIKKTFPKLTSNPYLKNASMEQLFATLPYFKGKTYTERLKIVRKGVSLSGSLIDNYSKSKPHKFQFKDNGFNQTVTIKTLDEGDYNDYQISIKNNTTGKTIFTKTIVYGVFNEATQQEFKTLRWIF